MNNSITYGSAMKARACVIGSGPNGLAGAIVLAQAGLAVDVLEAQPTPGGGARTMELTLPGFHHDFGSAVHPLGVGSPFFSSLPLRDHGLDWIHSPAAVAHPLDDGTAVTLERNLDNVKTSLGVDGPTWQRLVRPFVEHWSGFAQDVLGPVVSIPKHPWLMARFGMTALLPARTIARRFQSERTRALFAGLAAHSFLSLEEPLSGAFAMLMGITAHAVGWPIPRGGAQLLTNALCSYLSTFGTEVRVSSPVQSISSLPEYDVVLCDVTPRQLLNLGGVQFSRPYRRKLEKFRYGSGVFKVDYALSTPIPWTARDCFRAATVHLGGSFDEIAASERLVRGGQNTDHPFVLLAQPTLFDPSRAPAGWHIAWAYCHVPNGSKTDMLEAIENQIERFAPGFSETVLARSTFSPANLESMDANLIGGDINGGVMDFRHFLWRPTWHNYSTSAKNLYICSSSTPPGGGVHGMCGYHAARIALTRRN
jgi:phytoene dehydrogenase-like protein